MVNSKQVKSIMNVLSPKIISILGENYIKLAIDTIITRMEKETLGFNVVNEAHYKLLNDRVRKMKVRWSDIKLNEELIEAEIIKYQHVLEKEFNTSGSENIRNKVLLEINDWRENKNSLLHQYRYIEHKKRRQIVSALNNDLEVIITNNILMKDEGVITINKMPNALAIPIDYSSRNKIDLNSRINSIDISDNNYIVDTYKIDDNTVFQSLLGIEAYKNDFTRDVIKCLNATDFSIIISLLNMADESLFINREVTTTTISILKDLKRPDNPHNYKTLKESLYKIQFMKLRVVDEHNRGFTFQIIDNLKIFKEKNVEHISVTFNIDIIEQLKGNELTSMYKDVIDNYVLPMSAILIYQLQDLREELAESNSGILSSKVDYTFFRKRVYFKDTRKSRNIKAIEDTLTEIKMSKTTLKDFSRVGDYFTLEFYPITAKEKRDFVLS